MIYKAYEEIKNTKIRGDGTKISKQLSDLFGISTSEWGRLKVVYEASQETDGELAASLIKRVEAGELTINQAYTELKKKRDDQKLRQKLPPSVNLRDVHMATMRAHPQYTVWAAALRLNVPVKTNGMDDESVTDCIQMLRATATAMKQAADHLARHQAGGSITNAR